MARHREGLLSPNLVRLLILACACAGSGVFPTDLSAQGEALSEPVPQLLNVFLDCHLVVSCDVDHFRREVRALLTDAGVIRRHPDIRWNRSEEDIMQYQKQQAELLVQAARLVEPGGILVYATCSIEPEENAESVASFLREHSDFHADGLGTGTRRSVGRVTR